MCFIKAEKASHELQTIAVQNWLITKEKVNKTKQRCRSESILGNLGTTGKYLGRLKWDERDELKIRLTHL